MKDNTDIGGIVEGLIVEQKKLKAEKNAFWVEAIGAEIAEEAKVKMLKATTPQPPFGKGADITDYMLIIGCENACVRFELSRRKEEITDKVNDVLQKEGKRVVNLIFR